MHQPEIRAATTRRQAVYALLIALSLGHAAGRLLAVNSVDNSRLEGYLNQKNPERERKLQRPFLSSNDRSRWATVRSLVEHGTYAIDAIQDQPGWDTIDMVQHEGWDGTAHLYSSKPPLLATLVAVPYWLIHTSTGWTLGDHPYVIGRSLLVVLNLGSLAALFCLLSVMVDMLGSSDWGRYFVMATATFATFLSTFAVVLNNHLFAAASAAACLFAGLRIAIQGDRRPRTFATCGFFAAFSAACELPALSLFALAGLVLLWRFPRPTITAFVPASLIVVAAFFATNYIAHQSVRPPYMHRSETDPDDNWYVFTYERGGRQRQSYWSHPNGIDRGEASRSTYAVHMLVGHHGVFSLTPVWLMSFLGMGLWIGKRPTGPVDAVDPSDANDAHQAERNGVVQVLAMMIALISVTCIVFYVMRPQAERNYGGMTSGFRWLFWLAPLWLVALVPAADAFGRRRATRGAALLLVAWSALSAAYPTWNPWTHPWITNLFLHLDWVSFY